jgi:hypothetical protein
LVPVIAIVAVGAVVVVGVAAGAFASLGNGREVDGKYGSTPLASCDDVASRVGDLPPKSSETKIGPNKGWGAASPTRRTP